MKSVINFSQISRVAISLACPAALLSKTIISSSGALSVNYIN